MTSDERIRDADALCAATLDGAEMQEVRAALVGTGTDPDTGWRALCQVTEVAESQAPLLALRAKLESAGISGDSTAPGRYLLLHAARHALAGLAAAPVSEDVKRLVCAEFRHYAAPKDPATKEFRIGSNPFSALCKIATGHRYPAGQFDWEVSGVPRSWFLQPRGIDAIRLPHYVVCHLRGRAPLFFRHFGVRRPMILRERSADDSYLRMAESMRLQPNIRGFVGCGWFSSPDVHTVSPHLAWANRTLEDNGGIVVRLGLLDPKRGVLARSPERRRLFEEGTFRPRMGMVLWSREAMLRWADRHRSTSRSLSW